MSLVPRSDAQLDSESILKKFFDKRDKLLESYGDYPTLCGLLHKYIKPKDHTLILGAHDSSIGESLYDVGCHSLVTVDPNENFIKKITSRNEEKRPEMCFKTMEFTKMTFEDDSFTAVLDRGILDTLMHSTSDTSNHGNSESITALFQEIHRVLKLGGRYICLSFSQKHVTESLLKYFSNEGWPVRVHQIPDKEVSDDTPQGEFQPPVFAFVCTKFKKMPQMSRKILEVSLDENQQTQRVDTTDEIISHIKERQHYAVVRHYIQKRNETNDGVSVVLCNSTNNLPRYTLHVVDNKTCKKAHKKFAIFIVPEGREHDWLFSSNAGRNHLSEEAGFQRLLVTCLHRDNTYENLDLIKKELSQKVMELAPPGLDKKHKVPFLTVGDDLGHRDVKYRGTSEISGDFVVEDVPNDAGVMIRRLIFTSTKDTIQTEVRLVSETLPKKGKKKNKNKKATTMKVDFSYLPSGYQQFQVAGLAAIPQFNSLIDQRLDVLIIGLGGGCTPMFLYTHFPKIHMDVVDLDPAVIDVAKKWFGCIEDDRLKVHAQDGIKFIMDRGKQDSEHRYHDVIFDIDSKDTSVGMSCPPKVFLEVEFLQIVKDKILHPQGLFQVNIVARDNDLKEQVIKDIKSVFPSVLRTDIEQDVNEIILAMPEKSSLSDGELLSSLRTSVTKFHQKARTSSTSVDSETDFCKLFDKLQIQ